MSTIKSRFQTILLLAAIVFPLFSQPALAYKPDLHVKFSKLSWHYATNLSRSQLGRVELNHFGNEFVSNRFNYKELESPYQITDKTNGNGQDMIAYGAMWEDEKPPSSFLGFRPFNHFYDPQNQRPLTIELPIWKTPDFDPQNPSYFSGINVPAGADVTLLGGMVLGNTSP